MAHMLRRMLANEVDDRHLRPARIVQIGDPVAEAGAKMKKSACWFPGHACITICRSRYHAFKQTEHAAHFRHPVKCSNYMYFRGAWVGEAGFNLSCNQRANQTLSPVHCCSPLTFPVKNLLCALQFAALELNIS